MAMFTKRSEMFYLVDTNYSLIHFFFVMSHSLHLRRLNKCELMEIKYNLMMMMMIFYFYFFKQLTLSLWHLLLRSSHYIFLA